MHMKTIVVAEDRHGRKSVSINAMTPEELSEWMRTGVRKKRDGPDKLYERVGVLFRCVELRATAVSGMPRQIEDLNGRVLAAANFPTPVFDDTGNALTEEVLPFDINLDDLLWRTEAAQVLLGQSYWHKIRNRARILELRWLDPRTVKPKYSRSSGDLDHFRRVVNGRESPPIPLEDMVWVWRPGLQEQGPGTAPGQVAARDAGIQDHMGEFIDTFFERGAMPFLLVTSEYRPEEDERNRIQEYLTRVLTGVKNAFGVKVLNAALNFKEVTPPLKDMVIPDITDSAQTSICVTLGVPLTIVFSDAANFATSEQDDLHLYTKTIVPELRFLERQINKRLFEPLGLRLRFRPDQLEVFQQQEAKKVADAILLYDRGAIDVDELRVAAGYEPRGGEEGALTITATAIAPAQITAGNGQQPVALLTDGANAAAKRAELDQWRRKVLKRLPQPPYVVPFEPDVLEPHEVMQVRRALLYAQDREEVKAAFALPFPVTRPVMRPAGKASDLPVYDNDEVSKLVSRATDDIADALRLQYEAVRLAPGGPTIDAIMAEVEVRIEQNAGRLTGVMADFLRLAAAMGIDQVAGRIPAEVGVGFSWQLADANAAAFVDSYNFDLISGINQTSAKRVRDALRAWIDEGGTIEELADSLRPVFANSAITARIEAIFGVDRALMIAETEATRAYAEGKIAGFTASGLADQPPERKPPDDSHVRCRCDISVAQQEDGSWHWIWFTVFDERVCPVCGPLHGQSVGLARAARTA